MWLSIDTSLLDALVPMHLLIDGSGRIVHVGRTFERIAPGALGADLMDTIDLVYPAGIRSPADLLGGAGRRLELRLLHERNVPPCGRRTRMRGGVYPLEGDLALLVPYFGADVADAVARHRLTAGDLAQFDLTVEVLFLLEARKAVLTEHARNAEMLRQARSEAEYQAITDSLTGLRNRRALDRRLSELVDPGGVPFGLMHLDLDHFKPINDRFGHGAGDHVLSEVASILGQVVRERDMVARVGGDEFMILLENCSDLDRMQKVASRIIAELERPISFDGTEFRISGSIGITLSRFYESPDPARLIGDLDIALYASKKEGRARYSVVRPASDTGRAVEFRAGPH